MKKLNLLPSIILCLSLTSLPSFAETLTMDSSSSKGNVKDLSQESLGIQSEPMGALQLAEPSDPAKAGSGSITSSPEFKAMQNKITSNPNVIAAIQQLAEDPEIMAIMSDPSLLAAIQSGNKETLQSDPRLLKLANNPKMQALMQMIQGGQ